MAGSKKGKMPDDRSDLRRRADEVLKQYGELDKIPPADLNRIVHELQTHKIELEMQNDELRRVQQDLEISHEKYFDLYNLAPVGYFSLNEKGIILEANLTAATLLGEEMSNLVRQPLSRFIYREDQDLYYLCHKKLVETNAKQACEIRMVRRDGTTFWVRIDIILARGFDNTMGTRMVLIDISERKQAECRQALSAEILGILNDPPDIDNAIDHTITAIKRDMGFDAVGIRLHRGDDFPYVAQDGFSKEFLLAENTLAVRNQNGGVCMDKDGNISLECTCGLVISGRTDPSNPVFTPRGSFWTNKASILLELPIDQDPRLNPRNRCIHEGFQSVALIPLRAGNQIGGILQLNDRQPNRFTPEIISYFEDLSIIIGIALARKLAEDEMAGAKRRSDSLNLELEVANEDLEAFSYSVSHDLRAPLRHMTGFAKLLKKRMEDQQDEKSRQYALLIADASAKMERLIDDLLSYSLLGREEMPKKEVSLSQLLKESIDEVSQDMKGRDIIWKIGELPIVYCEPTMLKLVLVNLIANAVKFTSNRTRAEIEIACNKGESEVECFVKDNGVGFDMEHVDRLYGVFQRLHTQTEFEGTGIGLANVRRIIALHGGRTRAEGSVGKGATFYFSLPNHRERL